MTVHKDYPCHTKNYRRGRKQAVGYLVIHYVGATGDARNNAKYYSTTANIGASAHWFVGHGPSPEVWASVAEADTAWHCGANKYKHPECRNDNSIGVELCCHKDAAGMWYFDPETVDAAVALCRDIVARYGIDKDHVLRHYDVTGKICPAPFVRDGNAWEDFKNRLYAPAAPKPAPQAKDVPATWAEPSWTKARTKGIMDGTRPTDNITRQEMAVILDRAGLLGGEPAPEQTVPETADEWAQPSWTKAYAKGVMDGTRPTDTITRQEVAAILDRLGLLEGGV